LKILITGGAGMLGHQLFVHLSANHDVRVTLHRDVRSYEEHGLFSISNAYGGIEAAALDSIIQIAAEFKPDVIINAIGIVKQRSAADEAIPSLRINSLLPHRLALVARAVSARLIHFSTDCVFSGKRGRYSESDTPDAEDLYGRTKLLGEVVDTNCLTLRTSIVGHELERKTGLLEWFISQREPVRGFRKAVFSGFTTLEMARIVEMLILEHRDAFGVWHVSSEPIDKYALLGLVKRYYGVETRVDPDDEFRCDRSLDSTRFRERFAYQPPTWEQMIEEMSRKRGMAR
jgi:dTDP-4-dehydrorhamnose reductase